MSYFYRSPGKGALDPDLLADLRRFRAERRAGYLYDAGTLDYYERLENRLRKHGVDDESAYEALLKLLPDSIRGDFG